MSRLNINIGDSANDRTGDPLRTAFDKVNQNFIELYAGGGSESQLTNGSRTVSLESTGLTTFPLFNTDPGSLFIQGPEIGSINSSIGISTIDSVIITTNVAGLAKQWTFGTDGTLSYPNVSLQKDTSTVTCLGNASAVIYTSSAQNQHTIKLLIQVEGSVPGEQYETQSCEMIIAKSFRGNDIASSVYGIVHTSESPLATFTAEWNVLTSRIDVICTASSAIDVYVRTFATEITTSD